MSCMFDSALFIPEKSEVKIKKNQFLNVILKNFEIDTHHMKMLFNSFDLDDHTIRFHPQV